MMTFKNEFNGETYHIDEVKAMEHLESGRLVLLLNKKGERLFGNMPYHLRPHVPAICGENICEKPLYLETPKMGINSQLLYEALRP